MNHTAVIQQIPDVNTQDQIRQLYDLSGLAPGDVVTRKTYSNGQVMTALSMSPLSERTESRLIVKTKMPVPCLLDVEMSLSARFRHSFFCVELYDDGQGMRANQPDIEVVAVSQSTADNGATYTAVAGTIITIQLSAPFNGFLSDWVSLYGLVDNRLNYPNLCVKYISYDRLTITCGFSDDVALPSLAVPVINPPAQTCFLSLYNNAGGATHAATWRFTGATVTQAVVATQYGGNDVQISGTLVGDHRVTIGTTVPVYNAGIRGQTELRASNRYRIEVRPTETVFYDRTSDGTTAYNPRVPRTAVKPSTEALLIPRVRAVSPRSMTRPVAKIVQAVKAGSTTATITTAAPHGLVTGNYVTIKGIRDQTGFANLATPTAITVVDATNFTVAFGASTTATSYGGAVILANGNIDQQGLITQVVQSAQWDASQQALTLVGSAAWSTGVGVLNVGDYVEIYGLRDNTNGADLGIDGTWEVGWINSTSLELIPLVAINGAQVSPSISSLGLTNCGGVVIHRQTIRAHDIVAESWGEARMMLDGAGTTRADKAMPVHMTNSVGITGNVATVGAAAHDAAISGNPQRIAGRARTSHYTAVANDDVADLVTTLAGVLTSKPYAIPEQGWNASLSLTGTTAVPIQAAAGAGLKRHPTASQVINTGGGVVDIIILDGATERWRMPLPQNVPWDFTLPTEIVTTANTALNANLSAASTVRWNFQGYTAP